MPKLTINGIEVEVPAGTTVLGRVPLIEMGEAKG